MGMGSAQDTTSAPPSHKPVLRHFFYLQLQQSVTFEYRGDPGEWGKMPTLRTFVIFWASSFSDPQILQPSRASFFTSRVNKMI
jgi:hypothetical protein